MTTVEALIQLRDDIKKWVTINLNAIGKPKASDIKIDAIDGMDATTAQGALEELNSNMNLLWTNESPTDEFEAQTIYADLSSYCKIEIVYRWYQTDTESNKAVQSEFGRIGDTVRLNSVVDCAAFRLATISESGIVFGVGNKITTYGNNSVTENNGLLVPVSIYGYKL